MPRKKEEANCLTEKNGKPQLRKTPGGFEGITSVIKTARLSDWKRNSRGASWLRQERKENSEGGVRYERK